MANRLAITLLILLFYFQNLYSQQIEKINIKTAGRKDITAFLIQDLANVNRLSKHSMTNENLIAISLYKALGEKNLQTLKNLIDKEVNPVLVRELLFNILRDMNSKRDLESFFRVFGGYLKKLDYVLNYFYELSISFLLKVVHPP